jgi:hypothetical protein
MKSRRLFKVCVYVVSLTACISHLAIGDQAGLEGRQFQSIAKENAPDILDRISTQTRGNSERISTWQGEVEFTSNETVKGDAAEEVFRNKTTAQGETPQSILQHTPGTIKFIIDIKNESNYEYLFRPEPICYIDADSGSLLDTLPGFSLPLQHTYIVTPQEYLECVVDKYTNTTPAVAISRQAIKKEVSVQKNTFLREGVFDPRHFIYMGGQLWEYLARSKKRFEKNDEEPNLPSPIEKNGEELIDLPSPRLEESRDGNDIVYHLLMPFTTSKTQYIFMSTYFASEAGFNMVKSETLGPELQKYTSTEIKYTTLDGIHIPYRIDYYAYDSGNGSMVYERTLVFKDQKLNQPIPPETFTYKNLGLKDGDKFVDKIENKEYRYKESTKTLELIDKD